MIIGYLLIVTITNKNIGNSINEIISVDTSYNNSLIDYITGLISIKHTNSEKHFKNELSHSHEMSNEIKYKYNKHISWQDFLKQSFISSIEFIVNLFIIVNILNGQYGVENLIIINFLFQLIINSVINIGNHIPGLLYHKKIITKINDFYNMVEENDSKERIKRGIISIKNLSFSYNNYNKVLEGVNININMKDKIIIKGESGCGKSTLCKILNKEYDNYEGDIYLGNTNYRKLNPKSIRRLISYSSQNEIIFHDTIRNNILMGNRITEKKLNEIVRICELDRVIKKKVHGLDTFLYGGDGELSGGEKQLIILARSLVLTKDILILDETLSEVNDAVEDRVLNNLFTEYKDKMIIYVSHKNKKNYFYKTLYV
jgi:subfamily B ATP-binding cassette protein MsbA